MLAALTIVEGTGLGGVALARVNHSRLGGEDFDRAAERLIERAEAIAAKASPDYERRALGSIEANSLNGWFQRLDDSLDEASLIERDAADWRAEDGLLWSVDFDGSESLVVTPPEAGQLTIQAGALHTSITWPASLTTEEPLNVRAGDVGEIHIGVRSTTSRQMIVGWTTQEEIPDDAVGLWAPTTAIDTVPGDAPQVYVLDAARALLRKTKRDDRIRRFFLAPNIAGADTSEIDFIRIHSRVGRLAARRFGIDYETLAHDLRRIVFVAGPRAVEFPLSLPAGPIELSFAVGLLGSEAAALFTAEVVTHGRRTRIFEERVTPLEPWQEASIDLSGFGGLDVHLALSSSASDEQVALWANPILRAPRARPFNVVLYLEDTLRADHLSVVGYPRETTPELREFAREGVVFTRALAQATKTRPSVASMMTSLPPSATGVARFWERLESGYLTLAELLRHQGYTTAAFVQNGNGGEAAGLHQGFGHSEAGASVGHRPSQVVDRALEWIRSRSDRNFFVYVHALDPHSPYDPPPPDDEWARAVEGNETALSITNTTERSGWRTASSVDSSGRSTRWVSERARWFCSSPITESSWESTVASDTPHPVTSP